MWILQILSSSSTQRKDVDILFPWEVIERNHQSGQCTLWWPLHNVEIFTFDINEENVIEFEISFYCKDLSKIYIADIQVNHLDIQISNIKPTSNVKTFYKISVLKEHLSLRNNLTISIFESPQISGANPFLTSKFQIEFKILDTQSVEKQKTSKVDNSAAIIPAGHSLMMDRPREHFAFLLNVLNLTNFAVEVGVDEEAMFSEIFLKAWKGKLYIMVDPWAKVEEDWANVDQESDEMKYHNAKKRMSIYGDRAEFLRLTSLDAAQLMADGMLDFVYIGTRHNYFDVMMDMMAWWPKLKNGGILAGHDFQISQVRYAVLEFSIKMNIIVHRTFETNPSWYIFKL